MNTRVLQIINGELYSGAERVQDLLALRLTELGFDSGFACIKPDKFPERRMALDAPLHLVPMGSRFDLACGMKVARIVRSEGYRLVHTHTPRAAMVGRVAALLAGVPMVHHVHSPTSRDTESPVRNHLNTLMERVSLVGVNKLIPVSASLENYLLAQGFDSKKIRKVANGVPTPGPLPVRAEPIGDWVVGCVALFRPRKGLEILLDALAQLRAEGQPVCLRAVGPFETPEYEAAIRGQVKRLGLDGAISWTGFTRDVNAEFRQMDVFVLPSLFGEGMPMVILEAMAMGVPVVASNVEGIPEVIENGLSGLIVTPGDAAELACAIAGLMKSKHQWRAIREVGWQKQSTQFSDYSMAEGVASVYKEVLADG